MFWLKSYKRSIELNQGLKRISESHRSRKRLESIAESTNRVISGNCRHARKAGLTLPGQRRVKVFSFLLWLIRIPVPVLILLYLFKII